MSPNGYPLWVPSEDEKLRALYPDYRALRRALRRRTYHAIRTRVRGLGIAKKHHVWTGIEVLRLRKHYPKASRSELLAVFAGLRWRQIEAKAQGLGLRRARRGLVATGDPFVDMIRNQASKCNMTMLALDELAGTKRGFRSGRRCYGLKRSLALMRAIETLGGKIVVRWE